MVSKKSVGGTNGVSKRSKLVTELTEILDGQVYSFNERSYISGVELYAGGLHLVATFIERGDAEPVYEVEVELFYHHGVEHFIERMDIKCVTDFHNIDDEKVFQQFHNAKASTNLLNVTDGDYCFQYSRTGTKGLEITYLEAYNKKGSAKMDVKKFTLLKDYLDHQKGIHRRLHG